MAYESRLSLTVDSTTGERRVKSLRSELGSLDRAGDRASGTMGRTSKNIDLLGSASRGAAAAVTALAGTLGAREVISYADAWTNAENQIRVYTNSAEQLADVQARLVETAINSRSNFGATAELYATFARSNDELGLSQEKIVELTDTINKAFSLSGTEAAAAAGAIRQLGQGLASGALRGDEFNSVAEQAPDIMRAIAQELGMATGELREFAATGGITAEIIVDALSNARDEIDNRFSRSVATFSQSLEIARTEITRFVGESESISSAVSAAGSAVVGISENLDAVAGIGVTVAGVFGARLVGSVASATTAMIAGQIEASRYQLALARMAGVSTTAAASQTALAGATRGASAAMAFLGGPVGALALAAGGLYYFRDELGLTTPEVTAAKSEVDKFVNSLDDLSESALRLEIANITQQLNELEREAKAAAERIQSAASSNDGMTNGILGISASSISEYSKNLQEGTAESRAIRTEIATLTEQLEAAQTRLEAMTDSTRDDTREKRENAIATREAAASARDWYRAQQGAYGELQNLLDTIDPVGAELRSLAADISVVQEAFARGFIDAEQAGAIVNALNDPKQWEGAGKESAEAFINPWQSAADSVADSLQDAIASGDWDSIGDAIGGALGSSIAAIVNKQVTDSLAKNITADSGMFAQIGAAFAGPIAGAVAGGVAQLAIAEVSDWLSSSDWDPTEARQAAQGTRTILGDMDAKSESIRRAVEGSESGIGQLVGINQGMLIALRQLQAGISGASTMIARGQGDINFSPENTYSQTDQAFQGFGVLNAGAMIGSLGSAYGISAALGPVGQLLNNALGGIIEDGVTFLDDLTGGLLSDVGSSVFGGDRDVKDVGIEFFGATLDEMIRGWRDGDNLYTAQAYASIEEDGGWFGSDSNWDEYQRLGTEAEQQIGLVFSKIQSSVTAGAEILGMSGGEINDALSRFRVESQKISLEDLSADQQAAELEAVFSSIFDQASGAVVPYLDEFQRAGEGLGETLARVANQTLVTQEAVNRLGIRFSDLAGRELVVASERLMDAAGGVEQFITSMQGFIGNFASDAQKFELAYSDISRALAQSNLQLPSTRDGYYDLLQAQNGATAAGAENIATLLRLQGVADQYYTFLEDAQSEALRAEEEMQRERLSLNRELLQIQRNAISESLREAEAASGAVERALAGLTIQSSSFARLSRDAALASLQGMAASGRIGDQGQLDRALSAATNIQAGEFSTMNDYIRGVSRTGETLRDLKWVADQQLTREQRSLANIERQMEAMNEEISAVGRATAKHTAKTAKVLERIEVEGLEVRE